CPRWRRARAAGAMARLAGVQLRGGTLLYGPAHGVPEITRDLLFQVAAGFVLRFHRGATATAAEKLTEEITEAGAAARRAGPAAKIKSVKIKVDVLLPSVAAGTAWSARRKVFAVETVLVVHLPLLGIGEDVVGFLQLLNLFFCGLVARVQVRVIFPCQLAKCRANILSTCFSWHSQ